MSNGAGPWVVPPEIALPLLGFCFFMFIALIAYIIIVPDDEAELRSRYQTEVVDCHPFNTPPPISFKQFKEMQK